MDLQRAACWRYARMCAYLHSAWHSICSWQAEQNRTVERVDITTIGTILVVLIVLSVIWRIVKGLLRIAISIGILLVIAYVVMQLLG